MKLLLIHGRSQEDKHPAVLRHKWLSSLREGVESADLTLPIADDDVIFPYFGDALLDLTAVEHPSHHEHDGPIAPVTRGSHHVEDIEFRCRVLNECVDAAGIDHEQIWAAAQPEIRDAGPLSRQWVNLGLSLLDRFLPAVSSFSLNLAAADVARYLLDTVVQRHIETGIRQAMAEVDPEEDLVVIGHSLGSIIAYRMLSNGGDISTHRVRSFITIGSPLGITAIRQALAPIAHPRNVAQWFNAYDEGDAVALHPLNGRYFNVDPAIDNYSGVSNATPNKHGIKGYLTDPVVATRIVDALSIGNTS